MFCPVFVFYFLLKLHELSRAHPPPHFSIRLQSIIYSVVFWISRSIGSVGEGEVVLSLITRCCIKVVHVAD